MAGTGSDPIKTREKYVTAWNKTMVKIWAERINLLSRATGALWRSPVVFKTDADGRFYDITLSEKFLEYGLWQDFGTGREFAIGNPGDMKCLDPAYRKAHKLDKPRQRGPKWGGGMTSGHPRERRRWFSPRYYSSVMNLRDFMAMSLGDEFKSFFCNTLEAAEARGSTAYYRKKGFVP